MSDLRIDGDDIRIWRRSAGIQGAGCFIAGLVCLFGVLANVIHVQRIARELGHEGHAAADYTAMAICGAFNVLFMLVSGICWCFRSTYTINRRLDRVTEQLEFVLPGSWGAWKLKRDEYPFAEFHTVEVDSRSRRSGHFVMLRGDKKSLCIAHYVMDREAAAKLGEDVAAASGLKLNHA